MILVVIKVVSSSCVNFLLKLKHLKLTVLEAESPRVPAELASLEAFVLDSLLATFLLCPHVASSLCTCIPAVSLRVETPVILDHVLAF